MGTVNVTLGDGKKLNLVLGQQLENAVTAVVFDFSAWKTEFGSGTLSLSVQRHGDDQPYAVVPTVSGNNATWNITELDTAYKGVGEVQVTYTVGSVVKKSTVYKFTVYRSLGENGEYPSPGQTWQEEIEDELADVKQDTNKLICHNLMGNEAKKTYPVYIPVGDSFTISTSDGSVFPSNGTLRVYLYKADGTEMTWYGLATGTPSRTITLGSSYTTAYYLSFNEIPHVPLMVNYGSAALPYEVYFSSAPKELKKHALEIERLNKAVDNLDVGWYAGEITTIGTGFVSLSGKITSNSGYKYVKYVPKVSSQRIKVDSIYIPTEASTLSTFAFFDTSDNLIESVLNSEINTTGVGNTFTDVEWDIPVGTAYVLITFGNMSSSTTFPTISEYGSYKPAENKRVFNQHLESNYKEQLYFHCEASELGDYTTLSFNAKFKTVRPVISYDLFFTGYAQDYTGRTFTIYKTGLTKGINGDTVEIHENFQNTSNSIKSMYWNGALVNLTYDSASASSGSQIRISNQYGIVSEYCVLNDKQIELAQYPTAGYYVTSKEYHEPFNPMLGGYLCAIGDSLTAVYYKSEEESWVSLIARWNNMRYDNFGISGNPMAKSASYTENECMAERVDDLDASKFYTHIFVMGGANDYNFSIPIGENTDTQITTFKGAINHIITTLTSKFPQAKIVFGTTYRRNANHLDKPYAEAMLEVCKLHSIPCLNNYENSGVQFFDENWMRIHGATNALGNNHLNATGDLFVAPRFEHAMKYGIC